MAVAVGIDVAKEIHWVEIKVAEAGQVLSSHAVANTPPAIGELIDEIRAVEVEQGRRGSGWICWAGSRRCWRRCCSMPG